MEFLDFWPLDEEKSTTLQCTVIFNTMHRAIGDSKNASRKIELCNASIHEFGVHFHCGMDCISDTQF